MQPVMCGKHLVGGRGQRTVPHNAGVAGSSPAPAVPAKQRAFILGLGLQLESRHAMPAKQRAFFWESVWLELPAAAVFLGRHRFHFQASCLPGNHFGTLVQVVYNLWHLFFVNPNPSYESPVPEARPRREVEGYRAADRKAAR